MVDRRKRKNIKRRLFLAFLIAALVFLSSLCGAIFYYYYHPSAIKSLIEKSVAQSTKTSFKIQELSFSLRPLRVQARGIVFKPGKDLHGFDLEIPELIADMSLDGKFGHRSLTLKKLKIDGFSFHVSHDLILPGIEQKTQDSSIISRLLKRLLALFFFREVDFQAAQIINGRITAQMRDQTLRISEIQAHLNKDHLMEISCETDLQWPSRKIQFTAPHILITTGRALSLVDPETRCKLAIEGASFQSPEAFVRSLALKTELIYHRDHRVLTIEPMDLHLENASLEDPDADVKTTTLKGKFVYNYKENKVTFEPLELCVEGAVFNQVSEKGAVPLDLNLETSGFFDLQGGRLNTPRLHLRVSKILELSGRVDALLGPETRVATELLDSHIFPQPVIALMPARIRPPLQAVTLSGPISFRGKMNGLKADEKWDWHCEMGAQLIENRFSYESGEMKINGNVTGDIRADGGLADMQIAAKMKGDKIELSGGKVALHPFTVGISVSGKHPVFEIEDLRIDAPHAGVTIGERDLQISDIAVNAKKGTFDAQKKSVFLPEVRVNSSLLKNLLLDISMQGEDLKVALQGKNTSLIKSARALNLLPSGWRLEGLDSLQIRATQKQKGIWSVTSELGFQNLAFEDQDSICLGEKISLNLKTRGEINLDNSYVAADVGLNVREGEILYDRFYFDLNNNALISSCQATYDVSGKLLEVSDFNLGLQDILELAVRGRILHKPGDKQIKLSVNIPKIPLQPLFKHFVSEPFQTEKPFLSNIDTGGTISAVLELRGTRGDWNATGQCMWQNGELSSGDHGLALQAVNLDLPVWFQTQEAESVKDVLKGKLIVGSMTIPFLPEQSMKLHLDAGPNSLSVRSPTALKVPGGIIKLGPFKGRNIFGPQLSIETSLTADSINVESLLSKIWAQPIKGTIKGDLDPIHFERGTITTNGEIKAAFFDGEIILAGLGASGIFTSTPVFQLNARWDDLNLAGLTTGTSFGKVEGILKGYIRDLEIAYGQPQTFQLLLETVKTKGVPQRISVRAVDNIARIGGGQSPFMGLAGGFVSLFQEFPYKKIGVRASLENDVFRINGTVVEGGKEYIVKRSGFSGVNVVNQNPDNRARFKDMVKRIKRVTAKGGGPVIK